ncbi:antibiotic biosynthesis monooxygenase [Qipengyuania sp. 6B39]|uniref:putative quinol monooxygenase n=1 Tax=Qipengyuania proteolytica TaxID=2867239 RepID=UPI001C893085|nr:antibiotic biosynthesis monooxygenase [Qipengyuania proteolytica]MBX7496066.1 antibiotic biosynthesis monooxygenase [Qipengyuania proteolytica]
MIIITGTVELTPEGREEGLRLGCEHSARSRAEAGCISHNCYEDAERPGRMHFFEKWESLDAVRAHFAVPESGGFIREIGRLSAARPVIEMFSAEALPIPTG